MIYRGNYVGNKNYRAKFKTLNIGKGGDATVHPPTTLHKTFFLIHSYTSSIRIRHKSHSFYSLLIYTWGNYVEF